MKYRNPHALNARMRHAGYHTSERRAQRKIDYLGDDYYYSEKDLNEQEILEQAICDEQKTNH